MMKFVFAALFISINLVLYSFHLLSRRLHCLRTVRFIFDETQKVSANPMISVPHLNKMKILLHIKQIDGHIYYLLTNSQRKIILLFAGQTLPCTNQFYKVKLSKHNAQNVNEKPRRLETQRHDFCLLI